MAPRLDFLPGLGTLPAATMAALLNTDSRGYGPGTISVFGQQNSRWPDVIIVNWDLVNGRGVINPHHTSCDDAPKTLCLWRWVTGYNIRLEYIFIDIHNTVCGKLGFPPTK